MRHILRRREVVEDDWRYAGEDGADEAGNPALIVPFAEFRTHIAKWRAYPGRLGVPVSPADAVEGLGGDIPRPSLVAAEFPTPGEGRGYSQRGLLRSRLQF